MKSVVITNCFTSLSNILNITAMVTWFLRYCDICIDDHHLTKWRR